MAIVFSNLGTSADPDINSATDATSYANSSWSPPTSGLAVVCVFNGGTLAADTVAPTISGNGITWTQIATRIGGTSRITLFGANLSGATTGVTTIDFAANTQLGVRASFFRAEGVDLTGGVAAAFVQTVLDGGTAQSPTLTLAAASHADNRPLSGFYVVANETPTARTNWTLVDTLSNINPSRTLSTQWRSDAFETTASITFAASSGYGGVAAELKALQLAAITGQFSGTLADVTPSATGKLAVLGSATGLSLAALTCSSTGTVTEAGSGVDPIAAPFNVVQKGHNAAATSVTTPSISLTAGNVLLAIAGINNTGSPPVMATLSIGNGTLTGVDPWTQIQQQQHDSTTDTHLAAWWTRVTGAGTSGTVTVTASASANTWHIILCEVHGALASSDIIVQSTKALVSGVTSTPTLSGFNASIPGNLVVAALNSRGTIVDIQPGVQFSELVDGRPPDGAGTVWLNVQYALNPVTVIDWSNAGTTRNVALAFEIASQINAQNPTGRLIQGLADVTLASQGTIINFGTPTLNVTLDDVFSSIQAQVNVAGTASLALGNATLVSNAGSAVVLEVTLQGAYTTLIGSPMGLLLAMTAPREGATAETGAGVGVSTGHAEITLEPLESSGVGAVRVVGETVISLEDMTVFGYAYVLNQLAMEVTVGSASLEASTTVSVISQLEASLADATMTGSATLPLVGQASIQLAGATLTAQLIPTLLAEFTATLSGAAISSTGIALASGLLNATMGTVTSTASAIALIQGSLASTLAVAVVVSSAETVPLIRGEFSATLGSVTLTTSAAANNNAAMLATLQDATLAGIARVLATGTAQNALGGATLFLATASVHVSGEFNYPYLSASVSATGLVVPGITGELSLVLDYVTLTTGISVGVRGESHPALQGATTSGQAISTITGSVAATLGGAYTDAATSTAQVRAQVVATLAEAVASSTGNIAIVGLASVALAPVTSIAQGTSSVVGQGSISLAGIELFTYGSKGEIPAGQASITLVGATLNVDALAALTGGLIGTLADLTSQATAQVPALAEFSRTLEDASAGGEALALVQGNTTAQLDGVEAISLAVVVIVGAVRSRLGPVTLTAETAPILISVDVGVIYGPKATGDIKGVGSVQFVVG